MSLHPSGAGWCPPGIAAGPQGRPVLPPALTPLKLLPQVQSLEQQNKILTTRWNFLKDQDNSDSESDMKAIYDQYMSKMNQEMKALNYEQETLESELTKVLSTMDNFRSK